MPAVGSAGVEMGGLGGGIAGVSSGIKLEQKYDASRLNKEGVLTAVQLLKTNPRNSLIILIHKYQMQPDVYESSIQIKQFMHFYQEIVLENLREMKICKTSSSSVPRR